MSLIYVDWGSTKRRAFLFSQEGKLLEQRRDDGGVKQIAAADAAASLAIWLGEWFQAHHSFRLLISGMVTSREGWFPSPSLKLPLSLSALEQHLYRKHAGSPLGEVMLVPGLQGITEDGAPEFMRGEETQVYLAMQQAQIQDGCFILPGTHSKWVVVEQGQMRSFKTFLSGELYALLTEHSLLKGHKQETLAMDAFDEGLAESRRADGGPGQLLHLLFRGRAKVLDKAMAPGKLPSWLSGLLIGCEVKQGMSWFQSRQRGTLRVLGDGGLMACYQRVFEQWGHPVEFMSLEAMVPQIVGLARRAGLLSEGTS